MAERTRRGKLRKAREGKIVATGSPDYGFHYTEARDNYTVNEECMQVVRRIFYMIGGENQSLYAVRKALENEGVPAPSGRRTWNVPCIRNIISMNFCHFTPDYDSFSSLPGWAKETLKVHKDDEREHVYNHEQLENAGTHDEYWNAAMDEMRYTGYMHNYMRMYWGKKILEWSASPEEALRRRCTSTTNTSSTGATRTRTPTSRGSSASTTGVGRSERPSARCATCPPGAWSARQSPRGTSRRWSAL